MTCNFSPLRNLLVSLGVLTGFAASSAVFAMVWQSHGGYPIVTTISYSAAATWALAALVVLGFALSALGTFCACASGMAACASACSSIRPVLLTLLGCLAALIGGCLVEAGDWADLGSAIWIGITLAASGATVLIGTVGFYGSKLSSCQG